jgi:hypothetical protein
MNTKKLPALIIRLFAAIGLSLIVYLGIALATDIGNLDRTRGGYEAPFVDFTGEPLRFEDVVHTAEGGLIRGRVLDSLVSCETGAWRFELFGFGFEYRGVSERALVVHRPQVLCRERGFDTTAWDMGY